MIDQITFCLDENQAAVADAYLRGLHRIVCVLGVRGSGKSGFIRSLILMASISSKKQVLYASQSNGNSLDQFQKIVDNETVKEYLYQGYDKEPFTTKPIPIIRWANGSETLFWSMESPQSKRGLHPHLIIADECQSISKTSWSKILYPMRVRFGGKAAPILCFGSTPETDGHWFYEQYLKGQDAGNKAGVKSFAFDISTSLPFKGEAGRQLLAEARENMALADFESEFLLKPGGRGDTYFNHQDIDACVKAYNAADVDWKFTKGTLMPFDPALGRQDPAAYCILDFKGNIIASKSIGKDFTDTQQVQHLIETAKQYKSLVVVESNSTAYMTYLGALKTLLPYGVKDIPLRSVATKAGEAKSALCKQLSWMLEHRTIRINPECVELVKQLKSIRDYKTPGGMLQIRAPDGQHDDEAFSAVIGAEALAKGWSPYLMGYNNPASRLL